MIAGIIMQSGNYPLPHPRKPASTHPGARAFPFSAHFLSHPAPLRLLNTNPVTAVSILFINSRINSGDPSPFRSKFRIPIGNPYSLS